MDKNQAIQKLLNGTASEEEISLLKDELASGEISIGGNINQSVIIIGSGNTVELTPQALDRLGGRSLLGDLDRDLTRDEIASGLTRLEAELPLRAPILLTQFHEQTRRLRPSLKTNARSLSDHARKERVEGLAQINNLCMEALDISFSALCLGEELPEYDSRSPFRGLESFRSEDNEFFFGREVLTKKLVARIQSHPFLALLGASGSGKSSLVMAGLIPAFGSEYIIFRPGTNPLEELESVKENVLVVVDQFEELFTLTRDESTRKKFVKELLNLSKTNRVIVTMRADFWGEIASYKDLKQIMQDHQELIAPMDMDELCRAMEGQARQAGLRFEADLSQQILDDVEGEPGAMPLLQHALWELWNRRHGRWLRASEYRAFGGVKQAITSTAEKIYGECDKTEQEQIREIFLRLTRLDDSDEGRDTRRRIPLNDMIPSGQDAASIPLLLDKLANARLIVKTANEDKTEIEVAHEALIRQWERLRAWLNEDRDNLRLRESVSEDAIRWENTGRDEALLNHRSGRLDDALLLGQNSRYGLTTNEQAYLNSCIAVRNKEQRERERRLRRTIIASIAAAIIFLILGGFGLVKSNEATSQAGTAQANADVAAMAQSNAEEQAKAAVSAQAKAEEQLKISRGNELSALAINLQDKDLDLSLLLGIESYNMIDLPITRGTLLDNTYYNSNLHQFLFGHNDYVTSVTFSSDGKSLASGSADNKVILWNLQERLPTARVLLGHKDGVNSIAFSPNGEILASGGDDKTILFWNVKTGKLMREPLAGHKNWISSLVFSTDSKILASGSGDNTIILWDVKTGVILNQLLNKEKNKAWITSLTFHPNSITLASGSTSGIIIRWNAQTGLPIGEPLERHKKRVTCLSYSPNGEILASGSADGSIIMWNGETGAFVKQLFVEDRNTVSSVVFSPDGKTLAVSTWGNTISLWDVETGQKIDTLKNSAWVASLSFSPDGKVLASGDGKGRVILWNMKTDIPISHAFSGIDNDSISSIDFSSDGKFIASGSYEGSIHLWNLQASPPISQAFIGNTSGISELDFSPNGDLLASGSDDGTVTVWDIETGKAIYKSLDNNKGSVFSVAFDPSGDILASAGFDQTITLRDVKTGLSIGQPLKGHSGPIYSLAFSLDGKLLASGSFDRTIILWNVRTGMPVGQPLTGHSGPVYSVAFTPDGNTLASSSDDQSIRLWDISTHSLIGQPLVGHTNVVYDIAFSPDGRTLVSGSGDKNIILWDVTSHRSIGSPLVHVDIVSSVAFSPNGKTIASGIYDGSIVFLDLNLESWIKATCQRVGRNFTRAEWSQYFPNEEYRGTCPQWTLDPTPTP
jgi:WD40 repeat protein